MRLAAIDIGSNAMRLLINDVIELNGKPHFVKLGLFKVPVRLGWDVFNDGKISDHNIQRLTSALQAYKNFVDAYEVDHLRACATSAMRDASNSKEIIDVIKNETGIELEVIHGKVEADLIQQAEWQGNLSKDVDYLYMDVGGGSTEYSLHRGDEVIQSKSFNIGTIRILADKVKENEWVEMQTFLQELSKSPRNIEFVGSGGSINTAHKLSKRPSNAVLDYAYIKKLYEQIDRLTVNERIVLHGLKPDRADVLPIALNLYLKSMEWTEADIIHVPKFGLSDGMIRALYHQHS